MNMTNDMPDGKEVGETKGIKSAGGKSSKVHPRAMTEIT